MEVRTMQIPSHKKAIFEEKLSSSQLTLLKLAEVAEALNATQSGLSGTYIDNFFKRAKHYIDK